MRKLSLILLMVILCFSHAYAQSPDDQIKVLQKCIDLKELQGYLPGKSIQPLYVMQHGVSFDKDIKVSKNGKPVVFLSKQEVKSQHLQAYLLFWTFEINEKTARVSFVYNYDQNQSPKTVRADLELSKQGSEWTVSSVAINKV
ncbi:hypothetical protein ABH942_002414 [Flavobacterium sp. 28YEA47A]|uniref:hypothetical protein n=1 Tax=Flavobacterium sp. 28YEA47A TaxID=3156276 RepID=UPI003517DD29